jgi:preprotein translocase subunit YajC
MSFLVSDVMAAATTTAPAAQTDGTFSLIMMVAIGFLFYFMLIRPQNKRAKEHKELVTNLKKGDEIITSGGLLGKVATIDEQYIKINIAEGVEITLQRSAVNTILPKGTMKSL